MANKRMAAKPEKPRGAVTIIEPLKPRGGFRPGHEKTGGRTKGTLNKTTTELRNMITDALDDMGGKEYLMMIAAVKPEAFVALIGKVLPSRVVGGDGDEPAIQVQEIKRTYVESPKKK